MSRHWCGDPACMAPRCAKPRHDDEAEAVRRAKAENTRDTTAIWDAWRSDVAAWDDWYRDFEGYPPDVFLAALEPEERARYLGAEPTREETRGAPMRRTAPVPTPPASGVRRREYTPEERAQAGEIIERRVTASRASDDRAAELRAEAWVRLLDPGPRADLSGDIESLAIRAVRAAEEKVKEQRRFSALFVPLDPRHIESGFSRSAKVAK